MTNSNVTINDNTRILAKDEFVSNDTRLTNLNNNDLIVGPTGSGKTRYIVKPNLMQMNESVVVTDTKGSLVREVGPVLADHGYEVIHIDFTDPAAGTGYNPLDFIRIDEHTGKPSEQDMVSVTTTLCPPIDVRDPFWDQSSLLMMCALVGYVMERLAPQERTLASVVKLSEELETDGIVGQLMEELAQENPTSFAARKWRAAQSSKESERTYACIVAFVAAKLQPLTFNATTQMFSKPNRIDFEQLGQRKTAVFLTVSDTDRSLDPLVGLFYTQALQVLCNYADTRCRNSALPVPVRLYLDDFATNCRIDNFDKTISVIRSRNIAVSVVLQSITQLETLYSHAASMTIVNGCDHLVYLGGQDVETAQFISMKANKTLDTVLNQPVGTIWLFERGKRGKTVKRFELTDHPLYAELPEAQVSLPEAQVDGPEGEQVEIGGAA